MNQTAQMLRTIIVSAPETVLPSVADIVSVWLAGRSGVSRIAVSRPSEASISLHAGKVVTHTGNLKQSRQIAKVLDGQCFIVRLENKPVGQEVDGVFWIHPPGRLEVSTKVTLFRSLEAAWKTIHSLDESRR